MKAREIHHKKRGIALDSMAIVFLSLIIFNLNSTVPVIYADSKDHETVKNQSLIGYISDHVVKLGNYKDALKQVLQQIQTQIPQTSGQDKATKAINQINSIIDLNPNGPLSQSLLFLAEQQTAGNTDVVTQVATKVAGHISNGGDNLGQSLADQTGMLPSPISSIPSSSSSLSLPMLSSARTKTSNESTQLQQQQQQSSQLLVQQQKAPIQPTTNNNPIFGSSSQAVLSNTPQELLTSQQVVGDKAPVANAGHRGQDQMVNEGSLVTLDGSASTDPDGDQLTYAWTQIAGPPVTFYNNINNTSKVTFTAPAVPPNTNTVALTFRLTVIDESGLTDTDTAHITVNHVAPPPPPNGIIHGAMTDEFGHEDGNANLVNAFNNLAGKKIGVAYFSDNWFDGIHFPLDKCISVRTTGAVPFIRMQNWVREGDDLSDAGPYTHKNIVAGMFDTQLRAYAQAAKSFGTTLLIEYGVEVNGDWFPWSQEGPGPYKAAYRHIINLFKEQGVTNVKWAFHIDATDNNNGYKWYPGDDIIDWIGTSCYGAESKKGCIGTLQNIYDSFASISTTKPLGIFEWGIGDAIDTANTLHAIATDPRYSRIKLLQVWNEAVVPGHPEDEVPDGRINVNPQNLQAYRQGIANQAYVSTYHD